MAAVAEKAGWLLLLLCVLLLRMLPPPVLAAAAALLIASSRRTASSHSHDKRVCCCCCGCTDSSCGEGVEHRRRRADGWRLRERLVLSKEGGVKEVSINDAPAPRDTEQRLAARKLSPVYCVPVL